MRKIHLCSLLVFLLLFLSSGCAEKSPPTYYIHMAEDREMERHLGAARDALDDLEIEMAEESLAKAKERLEYMIMAQYSQRVIGHYANETAILEQGITEIRNGGVPVRVEFGVGYDPELMEPPGDALKLGDLRRRLAKVPYNRRVEVNHLILYYVKGPGRKQYNIYLKRLAHYKNHILRVMRSTGLPEELICVAMIESAGDPTRVSHAGAAGMWQFIPSTARKYDLIVSDSVDQRFDPILETYAAARYFKFLLGKFDNDIDAALASYNCGEGFIEEVLAQPGVRSVWHVPYHGSADDDNELLPSIPRETYDYIARWYAVAIVYQNMKEYGFEFPVASEDPFILAHISGSVDCSLLADDLKISHQTLIGLNPSLKIGRTPDDERTAIRLPPAGPDDYANRLRSARRYRISFVYRHKVTAYQTLRTVAESYGVSAVRIADVNNLGQTNRLEAGTVIQIPTTSGNDKARTAAIENVRYWRAFKGTLWDKNKR